MLNTATLFAHVREQISAGVSQVDFPFITEELPVKVQLTASDFVKDQAGNVYALPFSFFESELFEFGVPENIVWQVSVDGISFWFDPNYYQQE